MEVSSPLPPRGGEPPLTKQEVELLETIFTNLPKLAARAQKAWEEYGGYGMLDEQDRIRRPRIWIDRERQAGNSPGAWTMVIEVAGSDFGWHVEFVRSRFKEIWAGD